MPKVERVELAGAVWRLFLGDAIGRGDDEPPAAAAAPTIFVVAEDAEDDV